MEDLPPPSFPVTNWDLYKAIKDNDRKLDSLTQTVDEVIKPKLEVHDKDIATLKSRWVYGLTMFGSAIGAVVYLFFRGGGAV